MAKNLNDKATIEQLVLNTRELLEKQFKQAWILRDENSAIKISFAHEIAPNEFGETITTSKISFGKKINDSVEHTVDVIQMKLDLEQGKTDES
jgi:hypothetical protein